MNTSSSSSPRHPRIEHIAASSGHEVSPDGVVALLNDLLAQGLSNAAIERHLDLAPSYLTIYCRRHGITISRQQRHAWRTEPAIAAVAPRGKAGQATKEDR